MKYRDIADTGIAISEIGLGCWTLGGPNFEEGRPSGWAPVDKEDVGRAILYAVDHGVTHFDNADVYGNGRAEQLLAQALGERTHDVVIAGKVGHLVEGAEHAYEPYHIRQQCERSLKNLNREYIDIYYFHHGDFGKNDCYLDSACDMMTRLKDEGKIRCTGLSAYSNRDFSRLVPKIRPAVVQSWAHAMDYHFIAPRSPLMQLCEDYKMSFIAFSPLNQGILMDKYSSKDPPRFGEGDHRGVSEKFTPGYLEKAERGLAALKDRFGDSPQDLCRAALQFVLYHDYVAGVIPGFRSLDQVRVNVAAGKTPLNGAEVAAVRKAFQC